MDAGDPLTKAALDALESEADDEPELFELWPENVEAFGIFTACASKWTAGPFGGALGLDDGRMRNVMSFKRVKDKGAMFDDLRIMEREAMKVLNAK